MKLFITEEAEKKCGGCNWNITRFYGIGKTKELARKDFEREHNTEDQKSYGRGLCGNCVCDILVEGKYKIEDR